MSVFVKMHTIQEVPLIKLKKKIVYEQISKLLQFEIGRPQLVLCASFGNVPVAQTLFAIKFIFREITFIKMSLALAFECKYVRANAIKKPTVV